MKTMLHLWLGFALIVAIIIGVFAGAINLGTALAHGAWLEAFGWFLLFTFCLAAALMAARIMITPSVKTHDVPERLRRKL